MTALRLRQLVIATDHMEHADTLQRILALGAPYVDPGVRQFGLTNAVYAIGDQFLEFVIPTQADAPASRFIKRFGVGGYMAIFQVPDIAVARTRVDTFGYRRIWNADFPEIAASHIHPADLGGAIVSFDEPKPPESWKWGGPDWQKNSIEGRLTGAELTSPDPAQLATKWAGALGAEKISPTEFETQDGPIRCIDGAGEKLTAFSLSIDDRADTLNAASDEGCLMTEKGFKLAGVEFQLE
ncbi:MAG: hypothetical protein CMK09_18975 [Ponticaulis sp.]|nr:hypothetical protein [Ponticaulis sp.]